MKVVKINAVWCGACLIMNKVWNKVLKEKEIETISLDYDFDEGEVAKYSPGEVLPVFIFYNGEDEVKRVVGEKSFDEMMSIVEELENEENN